MVSSIPYNTEDRHGANKLHNTNHKTAGHVRNRIESNRGGQENTQKIYIYIFFLHKVME